MYKKTKIVATVSDARCGVDFIQQLYDAGMNVVRLNTAHQGPEGMRRVINNVREVSHCHPGRHQGARGAHYGLRGAHQF